MVAPPETDHVATQRPAKEEVLLQLERLLRSSHFRNSKRYPALLRYIVEETLEEHTVLLKERVLGIEVFGRAPDYDTSADPIVRVTIAEIRKRIAQYYYDDAHTTELRIELVPGSYVPMFSSARLQGDQSASGTSSLTLPERALSSPEHLFEGALLSPEPGVSLTLPHLAGESAVSSRRWSVRLITCSAILLVLLILAGTAATWRGLRTTPQEQLWAPLFASKGPVTFCLPMSIRRNKPGEAGTLDQAIASVMDLSGAQAAAPTTAHGHANTATFLDHELLGENVVYSDVQAMVKLESVVEQQHRPVRVRLNLCTNLNELREGPTIFIGGLDNQWTLKLLQPLRYRFAGRDADGYYIQDVKAPEKKDWSVRINDKYTAVDHDYAIIARVHGEELGETVLIAAGIGMTGTAAAGEFLSSPTQVAELSRRLGKAVLRDHDFEAVLKTDVVNGIAGPAQILAVDVR